MHVHYMHYTLPTTCPGTTLKRLEYVAAATRDDGLVQYNNRQTKDVGLTQWAKPRDVKMTTVASTCQRDEKSRVKRIDPPVTAAGCIPTVDLPYHHDHDRNYPGQWIMNESFDKDG